jgi:hypothetical protein
MAQTRASFTEVRQALDSIAKIYQTVQAYIDGGFAGEGSNTLLYGVRYLLETRAQAWTSDDAIGRVVPALRALLTRFDSTVSAGTTRVLAPLFAPVIANIMAHCGNYDATYSDFWDWWNVNKPASPNHKVLGEVAELMNAAGMRVDPAHCYPPEKRIIARLTYTGVGPSNATLTKANDIDPLLYKGHTAEVYCIARNASPDEIGLIVLAAKDETKGPSDAGATSFTATIGAAVAATQVVDIAQTDSHQLCSVTGATFATSTGGKNGDDFYLRVKPLRSASF